MARFPRERFDGHIAGVGTVAGLRVVMGLWHRSPFGAFDDAMVAHQDGRRELLAPNRRVADYICGTYTFDDVTLTEVSSSLSERHLRFTAGPLAVAASIGARARWGWALALTPPLLIAPWFSCAINPVASRVMAGVSTHGTAGGGRHEYYGARDMWRIEDVTASWGGVDLGGLADVIPAPDFGFSSTPRQPSLVSVTTFIEDRSQRP